MNAAPYLFFFGQCSEAMKLYQSVLGGEIKSMLYDNAPVFADAPGGQCPPALKGRVMHATLKKGDLTLHASDAHPDLVNPKNGTNNNVQVLLNCDSAADVDRIFAALNDGEEIDETKPQDIFWGARYATCRDRYDICWILNFEYPKK